MLGYIFAILSSAVVLIAVVGFLLMRNKGGADSSEPRLDERKGTSLREPIAEEPNLSSRAQSH